jgi:hypothetical protein
MRFAVKSARTSYEAENDWRESRVKFGNDMREKIFRAANVVNEKPQDHHKILQTHLCDVGRHHARKVRID